MSIATKIQWCDSTCNPTMGCEGCELWTRKVKKCYAGKLHVRFGGVTKGYSPTFEELTFWPGRMSEAAHFPDLTGTRRKHKPWLDGLPRLIFVSDMSDSLSAAVPFNFLEEEVAQTVLSPEGQPRCLKSNNLLPLPGGNAPPGTCTRIAAAGGVCLACQGCRGRLSPAGFRRCVEARLSWPKRVPSSRF